MSKSLFKKSLIKKIYLVLSIVTLFISKSYSNNYSLQFDGDDDHVNIPNSELLNFTQGEDYSIQLDFKSSFSGQLSSAQGILAKSHGDFPVNGWQIFITPETNNPLLFNANQGNENGGSYLYGPISSDYNDGEWHHIAITYESNIDQASFYFDGVMISNFPSHGNLDLTNIGDLKIGTDRGNDSFFNGKIDEV